MANYNTVLDSVFHALADPTRRAVVHRLGQGDASVSELAKPFNMSLPSFLKHIGILEQAGLIGSKKIGRTRTCSLNPKKLATVERWFDEQRELWDSRYKNLDQLLATLSGEEHED